MTTILCYDKDCIYHSWEYDVCIRDVVKMDDQRCTNQTNAIDVTPCDECEDYVESDNCYNFCPECGRRLRPVQ